MSHNSLQTQTSTETITPEINSPGLHFGRRWCGSIFVKFLCAVGWERHILLPILAFKVIALGGNRKPVYDFLLVINSNLGPISHRFWDTATYWLKIVKFFYPLSFCALARGDLLRIYGKALRFLKLESFGQPTVKTWWF